MSMQLRYSVNILYSTNALTDGYILYKCNESLHLNKCYHNAHIITEPASFFRRKTASLSHDAEKTGDLFLGE